MATVDLKSSSTVKDSGPVFQDGFYPSWIHGGVESGTSSLFSDRLNGKACEKMNGRYIAMMAHASYSNLYSTGNKDYEYLRYQSSKSTNDPANATQVCYEEQMKIDQKYCNTQYDFRKPKYPGCLTGGCEESTGFMQPPKELIKTICNSSKGIYRLAYNPPVPRNSLMAWSKSDIQLLNQFTSSASSSCSADHLQDAHPQKPSGCEFKQRKRVLLDLQNKSVDENLISQHNTDSLLTYDPRWTFATESVGKKENSSNNGKTLTDTYPIWESGMAEKKFPLKLEDEKSSFARSRLRSVYSTTNNNTSVMSAKETNSTPPFEQESQNEPGDRKNGKSENRLLNQDAFETVAKELHEGLGAGIETDSEYHESPPKFSDSDTSSTGSSSSRFYFSKSKTSIPEKSLNSSQEKCSSDQEPLEFNLQNSDPKVHSSPQKGRAAKPHPAIKTINELLEDPYENSECVFCKGNDQTEEVYLSHPIRVDNIVVCPYLRKYVCAICKSTGDGAHTIKYCPFNKRGFFAMREKFPPPNKSIRPLDQETNLNSIKKGKTVQNIWKSKSPRYELESCRSDQSLYSSTSSLTSTLSTASSCYSDIANSNRLFFQNLEKLRKNPKKQDIGCRST